MLAVAGGKGGCGKTTLAVGLARALARRTASPLVVDADTDVPDLHRLVGLPPEPTTDAVVRRGVARVARRPASLPGVAVVPAGTRRRLPRALDRAREWHGPVLVDCPAGCGEGVAGPLDRADRSLLVTTDRPQSREDARKTGRLARRLGADPVGTVVRETAEDGRRGGRRSGQPVLARVPAASDPLSDPRVEAACAGLAATLGPELAGEEVTAGAGGHDTGHRAAAVGPQPAGPMGRFGSRSAPRTPESRNI